MKTITKKIEGAYNNIQRREKIKTHIQYLKKRLKIEEERADHLYQVLQKEGEDVKRLERASITKLFGKYLGNHEEQLDIEKQEYLMAVLKYKESNKKINDISFQLKVLAEKFIKLKDADKVYKRLIREKKAKLLLDKHPEKKRIFLLEKDQLRNNGIIREMNEAIAVGKKADIELTKMFEALDNVFNWGKTFNTLDYGGKGRYSSYKKKKFIENNKANIHKVSKLLNNFTDELEDISKNYGFNYTTHLNLLNNFLEVFFDNLITDWVVRKKIKSAFDSIKIVIDKITRICLMLENQKKALVTKNEQLQSEINLLIKKA